MLTKRIKDVFEENNGILTLNQATKNGLTRESLRKAYLREDLIKLDGGIYLLEESFSDELYTTQLRFSKGIFSHETAVMLHSLSSYSPFVYHMSFPRGYHLDKANEYNIYPHHVQSGKLTIGIQEMESWHGNKILVTDLERTVVDMLKNRTAFPDILEEMIDNYLWTEGKDIDRLREYADIFGVRQKVDKEVLEFVK